MNAAKIKQSLAVVHHREKEVSRLEAVREQKCNLTEDEYAVLCRAIHCPELLDRAV